MNFLYDTNTFVLQVKLTSGLQSSKMDVNFPQSPDPFDLDILMQQMKECHIGLSEEYAKTKSDIIAEMLKSLQAYLDRNHPGLGLTVPDNGPHREFVMDSLEDLAILSLEYKDLGLNANEYTKLLKILHSKTISGDFFKTSANDSLVKLKEKQVILESMRKTLDAMARIRLDCEAQTRNLTLRYQKLKDLAKNSLDATGRECSGAEKDAFLGILSKGILSLWSQDYCGKVLQKLRLMGWQHHKEMENHVLGLIDSHVKKVEVFIHTCIPFRNRRKQNNGLTERSAMKILHRRVGTEEVVQRK